MAIKLQAVLSAWRAYNLLLTQNELDEIASGITLRQDESDISRKKLVEHLKELKKNFPEEVNKIQSLIKKFQNEVDCLSKRSQFAETAFLKYYQKYLDIYDPIPALEYAIGLEKKIFSQEELELENKQLKEKINELKTEMKKLKDLETTITELRETIEKNDVEAAKLVELRSREISDDVKRDYMEKEHYFQMTNDDLSQRLSRADEKCTLLQHSLQESQGELFEVKSRFDDMVDGKAKEIELLTLELDRVNKMMNSYQNNKEEKSVIESRDENLNRIETLEKSFEIEISAKDKEISMLLSDIKNLELSLKDIETKSSKEVNRLREDLSDTKEMLSLSQKKLESQKDYDEIKNELKILRCVEFSFSSDRIAANNAENQPLEFLLMEKNKILENDNANLRVENSNLVSELTNIRDSYSEVSQRSIDQQDLISKLEGDLSSIQHLIHQNCPERATQLELLSGAVHSINSGEHSHSSETRYTPESFDAIPSDSDSLLSIVSAQRERFKSRNAELEAELSLKESAVINSQAELESLRADNLKLYEKIRYLQSYDAKSNSCITESETRYSHKYEESLDPFSSFSQREKHRKYASLSPFQKLSLSIYQMIVNNSKIRTSSLIYVIFLHCLIFVVLYKFAFMETSKIDYDVECAQKFAEHMLKAHGEQL